MMKKHSKIRIEWRDEYHKITKSKINELIEYASNRFNVPKDCIEVVKEYVKRNASTEEKEKASDLVMDQILDPANLENIYKDYIQSNFPEYDFSAFLKLDQAVTKKLPKKLEEYNTRDRSYEILYIQGKNIFSFGDFYRSYDGVGLNMLYSNSEKPNGTGKSSLARMPAFLLYGNDLYYGHKKATYDRVFNQYCQDDYAFIEGEIRASDGTIYYIKRELKKRSNGKVSHKLHLYELNDNAPIDELIGKKGINIQTKDSKTSQKKFNKIIGTYEDYVFAAFYDHNNIEKWIETKPKHRYRLFCNYLGLTPIEQKYQIANDMMKEHVKKSISGKYNIEELSNEILISEDDLEKSLDTCNSIELEIESMESKLEKYNTAIKKLLSEKYPVDKKYTSFSVETTEKEISKLKNSKIQLESDLNVLKTHYNEYKDKYGDEQKKSEYKQNIEQLKHRRDNIEKPKDLLNNIKALEKSLDRITADKQILTELSIIETKIQETKNTILTYKNNITNIKQEIKDTPDELICKACGHVEDTSETVIDLENKINGLEENKKESQKALKDLEEKLKFLKGKELENINGKKKIVKDNIQKYRNEIEDLVSKQTNEINQEIEKNQEQLSIFDRFTNLTLKISNKSKEIESNDKKILDLQKSIDDFNQFKDNITKNKEIDQHISKIEEKTKNTRKDLNNLKLELKTIEKKAENLKHDIKTKIELISEIRSDIKKEEDLRLYLNVHSDEGISKDIIMSVLPKINEELAEITSKSEEFEVFMDYDSKKIEFMVERDGVIQVLNDYSGWETTFSCLALHYIIVKKTNLPLPNYLVLDEVIGRMGNVNYKKFLVVLNKLSTVFDTVDLVTHSHFDKLSGMIESSTLITKEKNISRIN